MDGSRRVECESLEQGSQGAVRRGPGQVRPGAGKQILHCRAEGPGERLGP